VIDEPLISESHFRDVQRIMDLKQTKHWRSQPEIKHRFTYNGFLTCSACGEIIHTSFARRDYYACKGRRLTHTCTTRYMGREKLEAKLDSLFADHLTSRSFLEECIASLRNRHTRSDSATRVQGLTAEISHLREKRMRVLDSFIEGVIARDERDSRLAIVDRDSRVAEDLLVREGPAVSFDVVTLIEALAPLAEWEYWTRDQKRSILAALVPDVRVADYRVETIGLSPAIFSNKDTHAGRDSSRQPA